MWFRFSLGELPGKAILDFWHRLRPAEGTGVPIGPFVAHYMNRLRSVLP